MTALKAHEIARFLARPDLGTGVFLAYGPDQGLVRETAQRLMARFGGDNPDPLSEMTFDAAELASDPSRLAVEARTLSMFGGLRRLRVRNGGKALVPVLTELLDDMPDAVVIVEAGNLSPRDPLRALAEARNNAWALPCYADNGETLSSLIRETFSKAGIAADPDAVAALRDLLGNDREITRRELEKLTLFAAESKTLNRQDVMMLCGDNAALAIDEIVDAAGTGLAEKLDTAMARAFNSGVDAQRLLIAALNHFSWLRRLRAEVEGGRSIAAVLDGGKPKPHFSRRAALEQQLRSLNDAAIAAAASRIYEAIFESRRMNALAPAIAHRALLAISVAAAHR